MTEKPEFSIYSGSEPLKSKILAIRELKTKSDNTAIVDIIEHYFEIKRCKNLDLEALRTQMKAYVELSLAEPSEYVLTIPEEINFEQVYINSLNVRFPSVRVEILRLSDLEEKYKTRKAQFVSRHGSVIQIYCEKTSIIKSGGVAFFDVLRACVPKIREVVGESVVLDFHPSRGLEGFARTFDALSGWFEFLENNENIAVLGQLEKSQIAVQLALSLFSGSFNFNQCIGQIKSNHAKTKKAGESNFRTNYSGNYTIATDQLVTAIKDN